MVDTALPVLQKTSFPLEHIIDVVDGAPCFVGQASACRIAGQDVIVIARSMQQLEKAIMSLPGSEGKVFVEKSVYKMVTLQYKHSTVDDEL